MNPAHDFVQARRSSKGFRYESVPQIRPAGDFFFERDINYIVFNKTDSPMVHVPFESCR